LFKFEYYSGNPSIWVVVLITGDAAPAPPWVGQTTQGDAGWSVDILVGSRMAVGRCNKGPLSTTYIKPLCYSLPEYHCPGIMFQ